MAQSMCIDDFKLWKVDVLRKYCKARGLAIANRRKDELVALAFAAAVQDLPVVADKQSEKLTACDDYSQLLNVGDGTVIPDPWKLSEGWISEKEGVHLWPPCMILNISDYLISRGERPLCERLSNDYKEGKYS
jgi:hypothetical protein